MEIHLDTVGGARTMGNVKYAPCILLKRLVLAEQLGEKTDLGFSTIELIPKIQVSPLNLANYHA